VIGSGGFGEVWEARQDGTGRQVAVKLLTELDTDSRKRFFREARLLEACKVCPQIVEIVEHLPRNRPPAIVMEYCQHGSLEEAIGKNGPYPWEISLWITGQMARALDFVHQCGGFHRDVKPGNMLIKSLDPKRWVVKLSDFGLGQAPDATSGMTNTACGTRAYMAPELFRGAEYTASCDIYSLGISFIQMITTSADRDLSVSIFFEPEVQILLNEMIDPIAAKRPTAAEVVRRIDEILAEVRQRHQKLPEKKKQAAMAEIGGALVAGLAIAGLVGLIAALFGGKKK